MTISRQTTWNRTQSIERLQQKLTAGGIVGWRVAYEPAGPGARARFTVTGPDGTTRCSGLYGGVYAWLDGYLAGVNDRTDTQPAEVGALTDKVVDAFLATTAPDPERTARIRARFEVKHERPEK
jgi:hypothetical protein